MITANILALLLAASTTNADTTATDQAPQAQPKPAKPKKICKDIAMTGSRLGKRQCKTQEQWDQSESAMELGQKGAKGTLAPPQMQTDI
ncbi:MAG: hypothetical protein WBO17_15030 [Sphingorhabdus sp.]